MTVRLVVADNSSRRNCTHSRDRLSLVLDPPFNAFEDGRNEDATIFAAKLIDDLRHYIGIKRILHRANQAPEHVVGRAIFWSLVPICLSAHPGLCLITRAIALRASFERSASLV